MMRFFFFSFTGRPVVGDELRYSIPPIHQRRHTEAIWIDYCYLCCVFHIPHDL